MSKTYYIGLMDSGKTFTAMQAQFGLKFEPNYNPYADEDLKTEMSNWLRYEEDSINQYSHSTISVGYLAALIKNNEAPAGIYILCDHNADLIRDKKWMQAHEANVKYLTSAGFQVRGQLK